MIFLWWLSGVITGFFMVPKRGITWGDLLIILVVWGLLGPITIAAFLFVVVKDADFWDKPIFGDRVDRN